VLLLHPSGLTYSITKAGKIENVRVLKDGDYAPLNLDEQYRVALPQYLAQEGIAGFPLSQEKAIEYIQTDRTDKEIIMAAFLESETSVVVDETPRISIDPAADLLYNDPEIVY
jgi:2',3'-cyclic-nucleotide 2'-phosphodiesterase (5'-nucleotidase family)